MNQRTSNDNNEKIETKFKTKTKPHRLSQKLRRKEVTKGKRLILFFLFQIGCLSFLCVYVRVSVKRFG